MTPEDRERMKALLKRAQRNQKADSFLSCFPLSLQARLLPDDDQVVAMGRYRSIMRPFESSIRLPFGDVLGAMTWLSRHHGSRFEPECHVFSYDWIGFPCAIVAARALLEQLIQNPFFLCPDGFLIGNLSCTDMIHVDYEDNAASSHCTITVWSA
jgi:hypothetical protein